jgi:hypothetical protein
MPLPLIVVLARMIAIAPALIALLTCVRAGRGGRPLVH